MLLHKAFVNASSATIKLSKSQLHEIGQPEGYFGRLLGPLRNAGFPILENVLKPLVKSVIITLELTATSATNAAIYMKLFGSNMHPLDLTKQTKVVISNEEMNDIMKVNKCLDECGLNKRC